MHVCTEARNEQQRLYLQIYRLLQYNYTECQEEVCVLDM